jgi:hypothetical protein
MTLPQALILEFPLGSNIANGNQQRVGKVFPILVEVV